MPQAVIFDDPERDDRAEHRSLDAARQSRVDSALVAPHGCPVRGPHHHAEQQEVPFTIVSADFGVDGACEAQPALMSPGTVSIS